MLSKLKVIPEALLTVTTNVGHYEAMDKTDAILCGRKIQREVL